MRCAGALRRLGGRDQHLLDPQLLKELSRAAPAHMQVYLILDEFILGGEIQESSKRVILERLAGVMRC